jgi:mRNA interferase MazF
MWKRRPVVIISYKNDLETVVTILPCTTTPQPHNPFALELQHVFERNSSWLLCNYPITVSISRLYPFSDKIPRLNEKLFEQAIDIMHLWLPQRKT